MPNEMVYLTLALYAASFLCYARLLYAPHVWLGRLATGLLMSGVAFHYFALLDRFPGMHAVPYDDLYGSMSLFAWLLGVTYLGLEMFHRQRSVGSLVTLLMLVWMAGLDWLAPHQMPATPPAKGMLFAFHVTLNTWGYAAFALSFVLSVVYLVQDRLLRSHRPGAAFWRFPALEVLDRMARSSVYRWAGRLGVRRGSGFIWARRLTGTYAWAIPKWWSPLVILVRLCGLFAGFRGARNGAGRGRHCSAR